MRCLQNLHLSSFCEPLMKWLSYAEWKALKVLSQRGCLDYESNMILKWLHYPIQAWEKTGGISWISINENSCFAFPLIWPSIFLPQTCILCLAAFPRNQAEFFISIFKTDCFFNVYLFPVRYTLGRCCEQLVTLQIFLLLKKTLFSELHCFPSQLIVHSD